MPLSERIGQKWKRGILAVILVIGAALAAMIAFHPFGSPWLWGFAFVLYIPFVLVGAAMLKYMVLLTQRLRRR